MATPPSGSTSLPTSEPPNILVPIEQSAQSSALQLSNELIVGFMRYLNPKELLTVGQVSKRFYAIAGDEGLWKVLFTSRFGHCKKLENEGFQQAYGTQHRTHLNFANGVYALRTLKGHKGHVVSVVFSPDGKQFFSCSDDKTIKIWELATGRCLGTLEDTSAIYALVPSPDGTLLFSCSHNSSIKVWDLATATCLNTLKGHLGPACSLAISPDGTRLFSSSWDQTIKIWDLATGICLDTLEGHSGVPISLAIGSDGEQLISCFSRQTIIWDLKTGKRLYTLEGDSRGRGDAAKASILALTTDGKQIILAFSDRTIKIWDLAAGRFLNTLEGLPRGVNALALSSNSTHLILNSDDKMIEVWNLATVKCLSTLAGHRKEVRSLAIDPDGTQLISGSRDKTIKIWDFSAGNSAVFKEIADLFKQGKSKAVKEAMDRFNRMPKRERDKVYENCAEYAFHNLHGQSSTAEQKVQAIENYLARSSRPSPT